MCEMNPDCDGSTGQLARCKKCGADQLDHEPARFSGGAGARTQPLCDEDSVSFFEASEVQELSEKATDYRREMEKLGGR